MGVKKVSNIAKRRKSALVDGRADYAAKRKELLQIAATLFKEQGFNATKLADIAAAAGLDRATVYYYVGSKEELFQETVEGVLDVNMEAARALAKDTSLRSIERLHRIFVRLMISYEDNYPATFAYIQEQMHQLRAEENDWAKEMMDKAKVFDFILLEFIREAIKEGDLRSDIPPRLVEHALFGMLNWTHRWFVPGKGMTGQQVAETFWTIFANGMKVGAATEAAAPLPDLSIPLPRPEPALLAAG